MFNQVLLERGCVQIWGERCISCFRSKLVQDGAPSHHWHAGNPEAWYLGLFSSKSDMMLLCDVLLNIEPERPHTQVVTVKF